MKVIGLIVLRVKMKATSLNSNGSASQLSRQAGGASATKVGTTNPAAAATTTETEKKGGFWSYLGQVFTPDTTRDIINTGLNIWSVKQTGQNAATTQNNLDQARFDLQDGGGTTATQGMGVGSIILISVGALALIGGIIYFVRKNNMDEFQDALDNIKSMKDTTSHDTFMSTAKRTIKGSAIGAVAGLMYAWYYQKISMYLALWVQ